MKEKSNQKFYERAKYHEGIKLVIHYINRLASRA